MVPPESSQDSAFSRDHVSKWQGAGWIRAERILYITCKKPRGVPGFVPRSRRGSMYKHAICLLRNGVLFLCGFLLCSNPSFPQEEDVESGHSIGKVSTSGDLIVMELDDGALGKANPFDLTGRTVRFTHERSGYRVETGTLRWDSDFGPEAAGAEVTLHQFDFPFSGEQWKSFLVGGTGSISFGKREKDENPGRGERSEGGVSIARFDPLAEAAGKLVDSAPAICVFFKPRTS